MTGTSKGWIITKSQHMCSDCKEEIERRTLCWAYVHQDDRRRVYWRCKKCQNNLTGLTR